MKDTPAPHHDGPRTFGTFLRDNVPMPRDTLERLLALEANRHPTLSDLRLALGIDLDLDPANDAARDAWPQNNASPSDEQLIAVIDAMYGAIASTRKIRVRIDDDGPHGERAQGAVLAREGERLKLYILADNRTEGGTEFSAETHGEGLGGWVEPHRTGSALLDCAEMPRGSFLLPVLIVAGGRTTTVDVPVESAPAGLLRVRVIDDATGAPVPARVYARDAVGAVSPAASPIRIDAHDNAWFHADGSFEARAAGTTRVRITRGIEYEPFETLIDVPSDGEIELEARLRRWSHMAEDGWHSGDVHVHLHYGGEYLLTPADASLAQRAEDVNFMNMMVANQGTYYVHDSALFEGKPHELSDAAHILRWGEEYRNNFYGHMCMYGIRELVPPIYSGFRNSEHPDDLPANAGAAKHCHDIGGTLSYAHPVFDDIALDRVFAHARTVEAKELPVDAALGLIDALDVLSYPSRNMHTARLWYRLLNCGIRLAATAGTDTFMNVSDSGVFSNPPAGCRVFARVDGVLTTESWCEAVRRGRTFVTNGPMIAIEVNGRAIGDEIAARPGDLLRIEASAGSHVPMRQLELIVNGAVAASAPATDDGRAAALAHELAVTESCWIAARATGDKHELVLDPDGAFAHTSPIYVLAANAPVARPEDAAYFVDWIDRLIAMVREKGEYPSSGERDEVIALFRQGQRHYRAIANAKPA